MILRPAREPDAVRHFVLANKAIGARCKAAEGPRTCTVNIIPLETLGVRKLEQLLELK